MSWVSYECDTCARVWMIPSIRLNRDWRVKIDHESEIHRQLELEHLDA